VFLVTDYVTNLPPEPLSDQLSVSQIKLLGVIASKQGLMHIKDEYPELEARI
jgi:hypothetical protein